MRSLPSRRRAAVAGALLLGFAACRTPLPPASLPFTLTPDAAFRREPPAPWEEQDPTAGLQIQEFTLANGLAVHLVERPSVPLISLLYVNRAGELQRGERPGLAALTARYLLQDSFLEDGSRYSRITVGGVRPSAEVSYSGTQIGLTLVSAGARLAIETLAAIVQRPVFDPGELEPTKLDVGNPMIDEGLNLGELGKVLTARAALGTGHRWGGEPKAQLQSLIDLQLADVREYYDRHYRPERSALVVVGDVSRAQIEPMIARSFGAWQPAVAARDEPNSEAEAGADEPQVSPADDGRRRVYALLTGGPQAYIDLPQPAVGRGHPDHVPLQMLLQVLAGGFSSRATQSLRHASGITYGVSTDFVGAGDEVYVRVRSAVPQTRVRQGIRQLEEVMTRLQTETISEAELTDARTALLAELGGAAATHEATAEMVADLFLTQRSPQYLQEVEQAIRATTSDDLRRVAQRYLRPKGDIVVLMNYLDHGNELVGLNPVLFEPTRR